MLPYFFLTGPIDFFAHRKQRFNDINSSNNNKKPEKSDAR